MAIFSKIPTKKQQLFSLKMGVSAAVTWTQECLSSAHAKTPTFTAVHQLSGWIKAWFILFDIRYIQLSGMAQEQRCPDNRGSTVSSALDVHTSI